MLLQICLLKHLLHGGNILGRSAPRLKIAVCDGHFEQHSTFTPCVALSAAGLPVGYGNGLNFLSESSALPTLEEALSFLKLDDIHPNNSHF